MELNWINIKKINEIDLSADNVRGVYVWGFRMEKKFAPYYVGITENIGKRILEHINNLISGKYVIYHKNHLKMFSKHAKDYDSKIKVHQPDWPKNFLEFLKKRNEISEHIDFMIDVSEFAYAEIDKNEYPNVGLKEIEKYVIEKIGIDNLANSRGGKSQLIGIKNNGCNELASLFKI